MKKFSLLLCCFAFNFFVQVEVLAFVVFKRLFIDAQFFPRKITVGFKNIFCAQ